MLCACCIVTDLHWRSVIHFIDAVSSGSTTQDGGQDLQAYGEEVGPRGWCHTLKWYRSCLKLTLNWLNYWNRIPFAFCLQSNLLLIFVNLLTKVKGRLKWPMRIIMRFILFCFFLCYLKPWVCECRGLCLDLFCLRVELDPSSELRNVEGVWEDFLDLRE